MSRLYSEMLIVLVVCSFVTARSILGNENTATENRNKRENLLANSLIRSRMRRQVDFVSAIQRPASQFMNMTGGGNMIPSQAGSCFNASGLPINQIPGMQGIGGTGGSNNGGNAASSTEAPAAGSRRRRAALPSAIDTDGGERRRRDLIDELPVGANPAGIASSMQSIEHPPDSEDSVVMGANPISGFAEGIPSGSQPGGIASAMQPPPNNYLGDF
ncbi:uncharacterized protein [Anabrus simplex]|uniref:uncharacterized protein n=1 Tax=Anabrus simplex TaxID=316456 RepID=UPI0035A28693